MRRHKHGNLTQVQYRKDKNYDENVYYFAYGVNLEEHSMKKRYPSAEIFKFGVLRGFKLKFKDGISSVEEREQSDYVEGLIYTVNEKDRTSL